MSHSPLKIHTSKQDCPSPHSTANKVGRVLWATVRWLLFRPSPRIFYGWRRLLLRLFGASVGRNARIAPSVRIWAPWNLTIGDEVSISHDVDCYCVDRLVIGDNATVSQYAMLCTASHDVTDPGMKLISSPITLESQSWICAGAFVGPGVTVGAGAVLGAKAVLMKSVAAWTIHGGNPARFLKPREVVRQFNDETSLPARYAS
ncbi:MAG: hypothetical protein NXI04_08450 [Planctomycetaceae bacterium]|nr:hypothetical protein [Planctomycetaceae bacterium]